MGKDREAPGQDLFDGGLSPDHDAIPLLNVPRAIMISAISREGDRLGRCLPKT